MKGRGILTAIALLAVAGIVLSSVSLYHHYGTEATSFCDFGGSFNCDMVNRSIYSTVAGIPVALIGALGYCGIFGLATVFRLQPRTPLIVLTGAVTGLAFALYLTYIEAFVLAVWCVLCLSSLGVIAAIAGLAGVLAVRAMQ
jgi:vitamin-K-epoxide reductase (warfarin-sensitive)